MGRKTYNTEQIYNMLKSVEFHLSQGLTLCFACRKTGLAEQTYYRWRKKYLASASKPVQPIQGTKEV